MFSKQIKTGRQNQVGGASRAPPFVDEAFVAAFCDYLGVTLGNYFGKTNRRKRIATAAKAGRPPIFQMKGIDAKVADAPIPTACRCLPLGNKV